MSDTVYVRSKPGILWKLAGPAAALGFGAVMALVAAVTLAAGGGASRAP